MGIGDGPKVADAMWWKRRVAEGGCCGVGGIRRDRLSLRLTADLRSTDARRGLVPVLLPPYGNMEQNKEMIHGFHGNTSRYVFFLFSYFSWVVLVLGVLRLVV